MIRAIGAVLIFLGLVFTLNCWRAEILNSFLLQLMIGPVFIALGFQLIK